MQKISKWQIFVWDTQRNWQASSTRKFIRIFWAYTKLAWALCFCKKEFRKSLNFDTEAMIAMSSYQQHRYDIILTKVRLKIGDHGAQSYSLKKFFKDVFRKKPSHNEGLEQRMQKYYSHQH